MKDFVHFGKKIIGVGRNYKSHIDEMGQSIPKSPFFFLKPTTSYVIQPNPIQLPRDMNVQHEIELGVVIRKPGRNISSDRAMEYVDGYCLALDLTARTLQKEAAIMGLPWCIAKGQDTFCPVSTFVPKILIPDPHDLVFWLKVNQIMKQKGHTSDMIFKIPDLISHISSLMRLEAGDLILTGTPSGIGSVQIGDVLTAGLGYDNLKMQFRVMPKPLGNVLE